MSDTIYKPHFFFSQNFQALAPVHWWVDEGARVEVDGEKMVRFNDTITPESRGDWFDSREAALRHVADQVRRYAATLVEKAAEIEA